MKIACLGWGSLIWDPRNLPGQGWQNDGPLLPIEFSRISKNGRVTLVVDREAWPVPTLWTLLATENLESGIAQLAAREEVERLGAIGRWPNNENNPAHGTIAEWAQEKAVDGVVWTALKPGLQGARGMRPSLGDILGHIGTLKGSAREKATEYVRRAPKQIATEWREAIQQAMDID